MHANTPQQSKWSSNLFISRVCADTNKGWECQTNETGRHIRCIHVCKIGKRAGKLNHKLEAPL